jgi:hypothetical protein
MNRLLWQLSMLVRRIGAGGLLAAALLAAAVLLVLGPTRLLEARSIKLEQQLAGLRSAPRPLPAVQASDVPLSRLPALQAVAPTLADLEKMARAHGFELERGQYAASPVADSGLVRWRLVLPLRTDYPALHAFLATALERLPNLALDEIKIKREKIEDTALDIELRLSLIVGETP